MQKGFKVKPGDTFIVKKLTYITTEKDEGVMKSPKPVLPNTILFFYKKDGGLAYLHGNNGMQYYEYYDDILAMIRFNVIKKLE